MNPDKLKELTTARARVAQLEAEIENELKNELAALPASFGFNSTESFISAVKAASGRNRGPTAGKKVSAVKPIKRRKRAKITDAIRAEVKKLVQEGKTGLVIAKVVGISLPSVQNVKASLGLVKKQK